MKAVLQAMRSNTLSGFAEAESSSRIVMLWYCALTGPKP
jgi:hypothetical protein